MESKEHSANGTSATQHSHSHHHVHVSGHSGSARHAARLTAAENAKLTDEVMSLLTPLPRFVNNCGSSSDDTDSGPSSDDEGDVENEAADGHAEGIAEPSMNLSVAAVLSVLLIGVFVSQADTSLVLATYGAISSEFDDLEDASWLLSSYLLAMCVGHALYGKLSDIFGRKAMLQVAYLLFAVGSFLCGVGQTMNQIVAARVIQGVGGAGMVVLVSILITDLVPLRDVASYRSYVNIVQTVGRSCGGAVGGFLAQTIGWRWAFLGQAPLTVLAMILVAWKLDVKPARKQHLNGHSHSEPQTLYQKMKRIDVAGAVLLTTNVLSLLLILDMGGTKVPWTSPLLPGLGALGILAAVGFVWVERSRAQEPIFPLHLLSQYEVVTTYLTLFFQMASQTALMLFIPLYYQVTQNATPAEAGFYMIPSIIGNTIGGLLTGAYIKRYGRYRMPTVVSSISAGLCFTLLLIFWRGTNVPMPFWQSLFVFFGGFATAVAHSATFVALASGVHKHEIAIAGGGLYLSGNIGSVAGMCAASAIFQASLRSGLTERLIDFPGGGGAEIIHNALSDIGFVQSLTGTLRKIVVEAYVVSFSHAFWLNIIFAGICLVISLAMHERKL